MFRTDLLVDGASALWAELSIDDYAEQTAQLIPAWSSNNGRQPGDPAKLARAIIGLVDSPSGPLRFVAGKDGVERVTGKVRALQEALDAHRDLSISLDHDDCDNGGKPAANI
jgi:hypothetical protein